jgi:hypothetical protein
MSGALADDATAIGTLLYPNAARQQKLPARDNAGLIAQAGADIDET